MLTKDEPKGWTDFIDFIQDKCSAAEFQNWIKPVKVARSSDSEICLEVPNIFVQEYLLDNYSRELTSFVPTNENGEPAISFIFSEKRAEEEKTEEVSEEDLTFAEEVEEPKSTLNLNHSYTFSQFIEGPSNQFVKSAALGVAMRPGKSYNPLFIHGGVGLGKTHLLHSIAHMVKDKHRKMRVQCITTEAFINDLVANLKNKSIDQMKRYYRNLDVLIVDDIQFLQSRLNFEEEFCNTFEALINSNKQIVISSDKPPSALKLSERLIARMEWGLVANIGIPDLETRVAILQYKAEMRGLKIPSKVAFFIAEHIYNNVRQLEGAINRLGAYTNMLQEEVTQDMVEKTLGELLSYVPQKKITVENILKSVSSMFNVRVQDLRGNKRNKEIAFPRQVAMYLAKELINESLMKLASSFGGKTHSTLLHSWNKIKKQLEKDETLRRQIHMTKQNLEA